MSHHVIGALEKSSAEFRLFLTIPNAFYKHSDAFLTKAMTFFSDLETVAPENP